MRKTLLLTSLAGLAACSSLTPIDDPVYLRINDIEARLIRIERVLENESLIQLAADISSLRTEVQAMRGEIETIGFEVERQGTQQGELYDDLDRRLSQIEDAQSRIGASAVGQVSGAGTGGGFNDQQAYDAALRLIEQQNFKAAQTSFENFLASYPASGLRSNAQYWLAESHYGQLSFQTALAEFQRVIEGYPESAKVPDAMLKVGYSQFQLRNYSAARQTLVRVIREFPGTPVAASAEQKLREIPE